MVGERPIEVIDIWPGKNLWAAPNYASCFGIQLEGTPPPDDEMERREQIVAQRRSGWEPNVSGWRQLQEITNAILRRNVIVKIWDLFVAVLGEDEGPYPITGFCSAVETRLDETGALQAYLRLDDPQVIRMKDGFDTLRKHVTQTEDGGHWINLGDLHQIQVLPTEPRDEAQGA